MTLQTALFIFFSQKVVGLICFLHADSSCATQKECDAVYDSRNDQSCGRLVGIGYAISQTYGLSTFVFVILCLMDAHSVARNGLANDISTN